MYKKVSHANKYKKSKPTKPKHKNPKIEHKKAHGSDEKNSKKKAHEIGTKRAREACKTRNCMELK